MSELRSALEPFRADVLPGLPDVRIEEDFAELQRHGELVELERLRRLAEIERRGLFRRDGHLSATAWLADRCRIGWGAARRITNLARALDRMPATHRALDEDQITMSAARVLVEAREANPEAFDRSEAALVETARIHRIADLRRVAQAWRERVERERDPGDHDRGVYARRGLHASPTFQGMVRVDGDLDPEAGEALLSALGAVMDAEVRGRSGGGGRADRERRTAAQRRADALHEICRQWLDRSDRPTVAGERPHITMTVPLDVLAPADETAGHGGAAASVIANGDAAGQVAAAGVPTAGHRAPDGHAAEFDHVGVIGPEIVRRLACDASVRRIVMAGASQPLDVGRRTPVVPPAIRRAVIARDRRCRFPGCDRPHPWCDAHHAVHWADGGTTALTNLVLLCRRHHRLVHERSGFTLDLDDRAPVFRRPDGTVLEDRAPP
jgi:hypothetical protein